MISFCGPPTTVWNGYSAKVMPQPPTESILILTKWHRSVGGFGKVHAIRKRADPHKDSWFALKTLTKASILESRNGIDSVMTELHALVNLQHPFICNIHYAFQDRHCLYLILDLALGGDLRYHIRHAIGNKFSEERSRFYIAQMLLALDYTHSRNFLHR